MPDKSVSRFVEKTGLKNMFTGSNFMYRRDSFRLISSFGTIINVTFCL